MDNENINNVSEEKDDDLTSTRMILKRIERKLDSGRTTCPVTEKEYEEHCRIIEQAKVVLPQLVSAIADSAEALKEGRKTFEMVNTRLTIIETEKKTAVTVIGVIAGIIGGTISVMLRFIFKP